MALSAIEATTYAKLAWDLIEKASDNSRAEFDEAYSTFKDEVRARYVPADDGEFDTYVAEAFNVFQNEWNDSTNWPGASAKA